jgi:hypothetical protein
MGDGLKYRVKVTDTFGTSLCVEDGKKSGVTWAFAAFSIR